MGSPCFRAFMTLYKQHSPAPAGPALFPMITFEPFPRTRGSLEMAFVPAGYFESEENEEEFDFGDNYVRGQYAVEVLEPAKLARGTSSTLDKALTTPGKEVEHEGVTSYSHSDNLIEATCPPSPAKVGEGSLSTDSFSDVTQSSYPGGVDGSKKTVGNSPVTFNVSNSRRESLEECDDASPSEGVTEPNSALTHSGGRGASNDASATRSSGCLKSLEAEEDFKVAVTRGNVEHITRILDEGGWGLG